MPVHIRASGLSAPDPSLTSIDHSVRAGSACLQNAGLGSDELDLLVNVGIYRHHNMCEPAVSAIIQHEMGICPEPFSRPIERTTFSFDLNNGACGPLSAVQVIQAVLSARGLDRALIVGADCHPSGQAQADFPITPMGGALLLERRDGPGGFQRVVQQSSKAAFDGQRGSCDLEKHGTNSRTTIDVMREPDYLERLQAFARQVVGQYLHGIDLAGLRLICSEPSADFGPDLAQALGLAPESLVGSYEEYGDTHTAALAVGWHLAQQEGLAPGDRVLFVNAGSGLTVGCALYVA